MIPTSDTLQRASAILSEIEALQAELVSLFSVTSPAAPAAAPKRRGRPPGSGKAAAAAAPKPAKVGKRERKMSPEGRARIAAAAKARWARFHAERKKADRS